MTDTTTTNPTAPAPPPKTAQAKGQAAQAAEVTATAADQVAHVVGTARDELRNRASTEAANLGDRLSEVAEELRAMRQASAEHSGVAANLVGGIADQVDRGARRPPAWLPSAAVCSWPRSCPAATVSSSWWTSASSPNSTRPPARSARWPRRPSRP